ncbi:hypothetical protein Tco_0313319 [Tanacetum coccineum]
MLKKVSPLQKWTFIELNVWEEFCQNENTPTKNQEERNDPDKATEVHLIPDICGSNYCLAQAPCDKNGIKTLPPELIDVSKNLVQATRELAQGSNKSKAGVDPLILVLGPEHGGRTRGVGCDIGYKKGIEGYVRKKRTYEQRKDVEEIRNEVRQQMKEELKLSDFWEEIRAKLKAELRNEMQAEQNLFSPREDDVPNSAHMKSNLNSTTIMTRSNLSSTKSIRRKEQQGEQNESISTRQVDVLSSVQRRSNHYSTTSIIREEHQGEQNESNSTRQVDVPSSVHRSFVLAREKVVCAIAIVYLIGDVWSSPADDEIPNLESAVKGFIQWPIAAINRFTGMSKTPVSGVPTKRVMPQHENAPSTKKGKGNETPKEPNKQDKALEETTKHQKTMQKIDEVKERKLPKETIAAESNSSRIRFSMHYQVVLGCSVPLSNERPLENKEFNVIVGAWFTLNSSKVVALSLLFSWSLESSKSEFVRSSYGQNGGGVSGTTRLPIFFDLAYFLLRFFLFFRLVQYLES